MGKQMNTTDYMRTLPARVQTIRTMVEMSQHRMLSAGDTHREIAPHVADLLGDTERYMAEFPVIRELSSLLRLLEAILEAGVQGGEIKLTGDSDARVGTTSEGDTGTL